ncbi:hypothetical protein K437DRAFT_135202 [Tilletiaria anomala UBC 951]|uniref:Uncharacterized protein n=1 Tax=Tilletiaria anomala (strain ATCC 24038 / CBS 436.72 / UBC 951) TaxID=1037660 RepID=A0A066WQU1_TILAU|nr:uncharacterized protein K437DRAFT_135202 [Tilletiaria anomala UBC 951]KDN53010.1 hypothetical protein K437DRAFT_135202 [Tilletiaria anomala UBC 951]
MTGDTHDFVLGIVYPSRGYIYTSSLLSGFQTVFLSRLSFSHHSVRSFIIITPSLNRISFLTNIPESSLKMKAAPHLTLVLAACLVLMLGAASVIAAPSKSATEIGPDHGAPPAGQTFVGSGPSPAWKRDPSPEPKSAKKKTKAHHHHKGAHKSKGSDKKKVEHKAGERKTTQPAAPASDYGFWGGGPSPSWKKREADDAEEQVPTEDFGFVGVGLSQGIKRDEAEGMIKLVKRGTVV